MKLLVTICKWLVGLLFIFSGLVKANDPLGLSYKMLEFFEKWETHFLDSFSLPIALVMIVVEVVAGVGIIIGYKPKFFSKLLLALIIFFTFLTAYVLFSGKIHACGCFGDCIPLTPIQTFTKDIILLILCLIIIIGIKHVKPITTQTKSLVLLIISLFFSSAIQWYVMKHLPFKDCLAYKKGNNILEQMKPPVGSVPDSFAIFYNYKKNGKIIRINAEKFPDDFDDTYELVGEEEKVLIRKGNAEAKIANFSLTTLNGVDTTQAILNSNKKYIFLFIKDFKTIDNNSTEQINKTIQNFKTAHYPVFIVTNDKEGATKSFINSNNIFICDATEIKTAVRVNGTFVLMNGATVLNKVAFYDANKLLNQ